MPLLARRMSSPPSSPARKCWKFPTGITCWQSATGRAEISRGTGMTRLITPAAAMFKGASGNTLVGEVYGEEGPPVLLLHGGGQTRHAWRKTGDLLARMRRIAYAIDQRGHGDSEWVEDGAYRFQD